LKWIIKNQVDFVCGWVVGFFEHSNETSLFV
jgi:hypothetical protein